MKSNLFNVQENLFRCQQESSVALNMFNAFHQEEIKRQSEMGDGYRLLVYEPFEKMSFEELNNELKYFSLSVRRRDGGNDTKDNL